MSNQVCKNPVYDNCLICAPDGQPLSRASRRNVNWYLRNNLATLKETEPLTIWLKSESKSRQDAEILSLYRENQCVVCSEKATLTRHHLLPSCFRNFYSVNLKKGFYEDVVVLCNSCHIKYEKYANQFKRKLSEEFGIPLHGVG